MRILAMVRGVLAVGVVGAISSCAAVSTGGPGAASAGRESDRYRAAYEIAAARCDRRTPECDIRTGIHYPSRDACISAKLADSVAQADLNYCADYGLRDRRMDTCLTDIKAGVCGTGVAGVDSCKGKNLCPWDSFAVAY